MAAKTATEITRKPAARPRPAKAAGRAARGVTVAAVVMEEARRAGLLDGERTEHVSFRAPKALIEAAKRQSGLVRPTDLGLLALAMLAQPDPTVEFMKETRGVLGPDHSLEY